MQAKKHVTSELLKEAAASNIEILAIDPAKPVAEQGNFDLILQKCRNAGEDLSAPVVLAAASGALSSCFNSCCTYVANMASAARTQTSLSL